MNAKSLIPLVVGLGIAGLAAKLGFDFIKKAEGRQVELVTLWAPVQDIQRNVAIRESMLRPLPFPAKVVPSGALSDLKQIVGRVPHTGAPAALPILDSMLLPPGASAGVRVPPGLRAVAVKIDESSGVDNHLEPGCHVDVVGVFAVRREDRSETLARTILENVEVAAVGQRLAPSKPGLEGEKASKSSARAKPARAVTLLVKPEQVPRLHLAEQKGKIKLAMRGSLDEGRPTRAATVVENDLLGVEPAVAEAAPSSSWSNRFDGFMRSLRKQGESQPVSVPARVSRPVDQAEQPSLSWVMAIYNGNERRLLGWMNLDDTQPIELSSEGPNIFQDQSRLPPREVRTGSQTGSRSGQELQTNLPKPAESKPQSEAEMEGDAETGTEFEPEELFE